MFCTGGGASRVSTLCGEDGGEAVTISGTAIRDSSSTSALPAGSYSFQASWPGDSNYNSATSDCEPLTVNKASTTTATEIHDASHTVVTSVALGTTVHDKATISGQVSGFTIGGTVTYTYFSTASACTGSSSTETVSVGSESGNHGPLAAGAYSFKATYNGDANYVGSTAACEPLTVNKGPPPLSTAIAPASPVALGTAVHDTATFSGLTSGFSPTGTVTYKFFTGSCSGSLSTLFSGDGMEDVTIGSGSAIPDSSATSALPAGSYSFQEIGRGSCRERA